MTTSSFGAMISGKRGEILPPHDRRRWCHGQKPEDSRPGTARRPLRAGYALGGVRHPTAKGSGKDAAGLPGLGRIDDSRSLGGNVYGLVVPPGARCPPTARRGTNDPVRSVPGRTGRRGGLRPGGLARFRVHGRPRASAGHRRGEHLPLVDTEQQKGGWPCAHHA
jgi:hypothetical protein